MRDTRSVELDGAIWVLPPNQRTGCLLVGYSLGKSEEWISCTVVSQHTGNFQFLFQPLQCLQCWVCSEALTLSPAWSFHVPLVLKECVHDFPSHCWWEDRNLLLPNSRRVRSRVVITLLIVPPLALMLLCCLVFPSTCSDFLLFWLMWWLPADF